MRHPVNGDAAFVHDLQQRRLGLRRCAVDLVGDDDAGEHRPGMELEPAAGLVEDRHTGHVGGQQIGRELDPPPLPADRRRNRAGQRGLADAGHVLEQHVTLGEQRGQGQPDHLRLAEHDRADPSGQLRGDGGEALDVLGWQWFVGHR
jgi:hypothetical protein